MKKKTNSFIFSALLCLSLLCISLTGTPSTELKRYEAVEPHMGTMYKILLYTSDQELAKAGFASAFARVTELDNELSDYKPDSELNVAAKAAVLHPVHVSNDLAAVVAASQQLSKETGGAFDITVGPLTKLWRQAKKNHQVPSAEAIAEARGKCDYRKLHLDSSTQTITLDSPGMQLDVGAIAKGYAADEALNVLEKLGIKCALVAASGDLAFGDPPPGQSGWKIGIEATDKVLFLANAAVSTSGASEQYMEANGKHYSHIIDPATGMGLVNDITVTTIASTGLLADPAATAASVLGYEKGRLFVERHPHLEAYMMERTNGQTKSQHVGTL